MDRFGDLDRALHSLQAETLRPKPAQLIVLGLVDYTHAAVSQFLHGTVARDGCVLVPVLCSLIAFP